MPPVRKRSAESTLVRLSTAAESAGVSRQTVEYYIMLGLVCPIRSPGGRKRLFDRKLVNRIRLIHHMNRLGYTLRDIRQTYLRRR